MFPPPRDPLTPLLPTLDPCPCTRHVPSPTQAGPGTQGRFSDISGETGDNVTTREALTTLTEESRRELMSIRHPTDLIVQYTGPGWGGTLPSAPFPPKIEPCLLLGFSVAPVEPEHKEEEKSVHRQTDRRAQSEAGRLRRTDACCSLQTLPEPWGVARETEAREGSRGRGGRQHRQPCVPALTAGILLRKTNR